MRVPASFTLAASICLIIGTAACTSDRPDAATSSTATGSPLYSALRTPIPPTSTPEDCTTANLQGAAQVLNQHIDNFDEYAALASSVAQSEVERVVPPMRSIRTAVDDQAVPSCLAELKRLELLYMDNTLETLLAFEKPTPDAAAIAAGILQSRQYHDQYSAELARLFGVTVPSPSTLIPPITNTP
jgi:hypothetical protein